MQPFEVHRFPTVQVTAACRMEILPSERKMVGIRLADTDVAVKKRYQMLQGDAGRVLHQGITTFSPGAGEICPQGVKAFAPGQSSKVDFRVFREGLSFPC